SNSRHSRFIHRIKLEAIRKLRYPLSIHRDMKRARTYAAAKSHPPWASSRSRGCESAANAKPTMENTAGFSSLMTPFWTNAPIIIGGIGLFFAAFFYFRVKSLPDGNETMNRIAGYIREGAMAFLARQYKVLAIYSVVVFALIGLSLGWAPAACFVLGAFLSLLAGFIGMKAATYANVRPSQAARGGAKPNALLVAPDGGDVMGLALAGRGILG